jgi:peptide-methionine (R)-S-oxide reductase|tara:strand:+ start:6701 stop:7234 length:534 start_codon:yes stop_codon:yes gene_type:complete
MYHSTTSLVKLFLIKMKKYNLIYILLICIGCNSQNNNNSETNQQRSKYKINKSDIEWRKELNSLQYYVLRQAGTERAFTGKYDKNFSEGVYVCAACQSPLYESGYKYDSKSGWPSFDRGITENIEYDVDYKLGYARSELKCSSCGGHLGHLFNDGPKSTTGKRHCINSAALIFISKK